MKLKFIFCAALLALALSVPAFAEVKNFNGFKADVPSGWTTQEFPADAGKGVIIIAPDSSAAVTIAIIPTGGMSAKDFANAQAQALSGKVTEKDGGYEINSKVNNVDVAIFISDAGAGEVVMISVSGNAKHPAIAGIIESIDEL